MMPRFNAFRAVAAVPIALAGLAFTAFAVKKTAEFPATTRARELGAVQTLVPDHAGLGRDNVCKLSGPFMGKIVVRL